MFLSQSLSKVLLMFIIYLVFNLIIYSFVKKKYRYILLLLSGLICYIYISKVASLYLLTTIGLTYVFGLLFTKIKQSHKKDGLEKKERKIVNKRIKQLNKRLLILYVVLSLGILVALKYLNFFNQIISDVGQSFGYDNLSHVFIFILPMGLSYYTLSALSYIIDISRGKYEAEKNILKLALFISFFPCTYMGPFNRYDDLGKTLFNGDNLNLKNIYEGVLTVLIGFFKIFFIANRSVIISDYIFKNYTHLSGSVIFFGALMFTIELYAEFSGYIDITRGISKCLNIDLPKNFNKPFISKSISEFWTRWHMSLGLFFKDYIFYPVSLSRTLGKVTNKLPSFIRDFITISLGLFCVWLLMGLWHGANIKYIVYGMYFLFFMIIYNIFSPLFTRLLRKMKIKENNFFINIFNIVLTNTIVVIGLMMFRARDLTVFISMFKSLFNQKNSYIDLFSIIDIKDVVILIISLIVLVSPLIFQLFKISLSLKFSVLSNYKKYAVCFLIVILILIFGAYGNGYIPPDPIYGGF